jgi:GNAT superfamily N-acetyltransferase
MTSTSVELARRMEATDAYNNSEFARTYTRLVGIEGEPALEIAGGWASFAGVDSPMTQAFGVGMTELVTEQDMERLEEFYSSRGAATNIEICPYSDPSLLELVAKRGYRPVEFSNVFVSPVESAGQGAQARDSQLAVRVAGLAEEPVWSRAVATAFLANAEVKPFWLDVFKTFFHMPGMLCFIAELEGVPVGGGLMLLREGVAALATTSIQPEFRNRGAQTALLEARLAVARQRGCDLAMVTTMPGTVSQRNVERQGFRIAYTRCKFIRESESRVNHD